MSIYCISETGNQGLIELASLLQKNRDFKTHELKNELASFFDQTRELVLTHEFF